jgi:2-methylaconitate isomerase
VQRAIPAVFMRGGTSKALMFHARDLPEDRGQWASLFCAAMGTPDPYGRQLDGMGGGVSSLSKVCVLSPSERSDADVDYTFAQVMITEARVDYRSNCGNMSSAVGPFALDEGLVRAGGETTTVRIFNTNTEKLIHSTFPVISGMTRYDGDFEVPGVSGSGAPIRLDFLDPGGATTGHLLPSGQVADQLNVAGIGAFEASLVDAANAVVFVRAGDVGLSGTELPAELDSHPRVLALLEAIRREAAVRMGIAPDVEAASRITSVPFVCVVSPPLDSVTLSGETIRHDEVDLVARTLSHGQPHRALPLTVALCLGVAARLSGSIVFDSRGVEVAGAPLRIAMPSGILTVDARVSFDNGQWTAHSGTFFRTARRLFDGRVWTPERTPLPF